MIVSFFREQTQPRKSKNHLLCAAHIPSALSVYTHPVTGKLKIVSVGSKSGSVRRSSAISTTILAVASERFFAERIAKTLVKISHSGCPGFCLARRGKYLQEKKPWKQSSYFSIFTSKNIFHLNFHNEFNNYMCVWTLIRYSKGKLLWNLKFDG